MAFGRGKASKVDDNSSSSSSSSNTMDDAGGGGASASSTASWIMNNELFNFVLMNTNEIKYMCMVGYTFLHGCKVFKKLESPDYSTSFKFIQMMLACTGGGILVPIFLNTIPVPLAIDAYPIAILFSFGVHTYFPVVREVAELSTIFKALLIVFYETIRAYVVTLFVGVAATTITASQFSFPIFGPVICGTIGGCGGAFLPFDKGLDPLKNGLPPPVFSAFVGAAFFHFFTHYANDVADYLHELNFKDGSDIAPAKSPIIGTLITDILKYYATEMGKVFVVVWFIGYAFYKNEILFHKKVSTVVTTAAVPSSLLPSPSSSKTKSKGKGKGKSVKTEKKE